MEHSKNPRPYMDAPPMSWNRVLVRPMSKREDVRPRRERRDRPWDTLTPTEQAAITMPRPTVTGNPMGRQRKRRQERRRLTLRNKRRVAKGLSPMNYAEVTSERANWTRG